MYACMYAYIICVSVSKCKPFLKGPLDTSSHTEAWAGFMWRFTDFSVEFLDIFTLHNRARCQSYSCDFPRGLLPNMLQKHYNTRWFNDPGKSILFCLWLPKKTNSDNSYICLAYKSFFNWSTNFSYLLISIMCVKTDRMQATCPLGGHWMNDPPLEGTKAGKGLCMHSLETVILSPLHPAFCHSDPVPAEMKRGHEGWRPFCFVSRVAMAKEFITVWPVCCRWATVDSARLVIKKYPQSGLGLSLKPFQALLA